MGASGRIHGQPFTWLANGPLRRTALLDVERSVRRGRLVRSEALVAALDALIEDPGLRPRERARIARIFHFLDDREATSAGGPTT